MQKRGYFKSSLALRRPITESGIGSFAAFIFHLMVCSRATDELNHQAKAEIAVRCCCFAFIRN